MRGSEGDKKRERERGTQGGTGLGRKRRKKTRKIKQRRSTTVLLVEVWWQSKRRKGMGAEGDGNTQKF